MTPTLRRGRAILFTILIGLAILQAGTVVVAFLDSSGRMTWWRDVLIPLVFLGALYSIWMGDDGARKFLGVGLIVVGAFWTYFVGKAIVGMALVTPPEHADFMTEVFSFMGYMFIVGLLHIVGGLLLFAPSVRAFMEYRRVGPLEGLDPEEPDAVSTETSGEILAKSDDSALCNAIFVRILAVHGSVPDVGEMNAAVRTAFLVWHTSGVIGNGGFRYLFESDYPGDPNYEKAKEAYETIGCNEASAAFREAFAVFPGSKPPADANRRISLYLKSPTSFPTSADKAFIAANDKVVAKLAQYIRSRPDDYAYLEVPAPKP
jgi:hypothetical protein